MDAVRAGGGARAGAGPRADGALRRRCATWARLARPRRRASRAWSRPPPAPRWRSPSAGARRCRRLSPYDGRAVLLQARPDRRRRPAAPASRDFADLDRLTIFADNLVPHVLRLDGVLRSTRSWSAGSTRRAARARPPEEVEIRACARARRRAARRRAGTTATAVDNSSGTAAGRPLQGAAPPRAAHGLLRPPAPGPPLHCFTRFRASRWSRAPPRPRRVSAPIASAPASPTSSLRRATSRWPVMSSAGKRPVLANPKSSAITVVSPPSGLGGGRRSR